MGIITNLKLHEFERLVGAIPINNVSATIVAFCLKYFPGKQDEAVEVIREFLALLVKQLREDK